MSKHRFMRMVSRRPRGRRLTAVLAAAAAAACSPVELSQNHDVRMLLTGPAGTQIRMITSHDFTFSGGEGNNVQLHVGEFREDWRSVPFDTTYNITLHRRILLRVIGSEPEGVTVRMQVWRGGVLELDRQAVPSESFQYVFLGRG